MTTPTDREARLLTDDEVIRFIADGFLVRQVDELGPDFHQELYRRAIERRPGSLLSDEVDARMPELRAVLDGPTMSGALQGLLGPGYLRHPHTGATVDRDEPAASPPFDQGWHRDSYWGVQRVRHHRPRWLLCMYYPTAIELAMGPTAIAPGSQYYSLPADGDGSARPTEPPTRHDRIDDPQRLMQGDDLPARDRLLRAAIESIDPAIREVPMAVEAGSVGFFHYDIYHRRMRRAAGAAGAPRVMFKFLYTSGQARTRPSWDHRSGVTPWANGRAAVPSALTASIWSFMLGDSEDSAPPRNAGAAAPSEPVSGTVDALLGGRTEAARMAAAYELAQAAHAGSTESVTGLIRALVHGGDAARRAAMHGLTGAGGAAVEPLVATLADPDVDDHVACCAVHALGEAAEEPSLAMVDAVGTVMDRVAGQIAGAVRGLDGWPAGGGGHPPASGFGRFSPNPKERQAWPPKLLHATCVQALGLMGQRAAAKPGNHAVLGAIVERCVACLDAPEPGGGNPDYPEDSTLGRGLMSRQNAALALRMLAPASQAIDGRLRRAAADACRRALTDADRFVPGYCRDALAAWQTGSAPASD